MGIKGLNDFIKKKYPTTIKDINISELKYKKLAIDTSLYLYKYKIILGEKWIDGFINLIMCLRKNDVHPVFIFDNGAPKEKIEEQKRRRETVNKRNYEILEIERLLKKYREMH